MHSKYSFIKKAIAFASVIFVALLTACQTSPTIIADSWYQIETENIRIISNAPPTTIARLAKNLERFRKVVEFVTESTINDKKTTMIVARNHETYRDLVGEDSFKSEGVFIQNYYQNYLLVKTNRRAEGWSRQQIQQYVQETLFHEYVHYLIHSANPAPYPYWYSEGIAEYLSTASVHNGDKFTVGVEPASFGPTLTNAAEILGTPYWHDMKEQTSTFYKGARLMTHLFFHDPQLMGGADCYLSKYAENLSIKDALDICFGMTLDELQAKLDNSFRAKSYNTINGRIAGLDSPIEVRVKSITEIDLQREVSVLLSFTSSESKLKEFIESVDRRGLDSGIMRLSLANYYLESGEFDLATQTMQSVASNYADDPWGQYVFARWWLTHAIKADDGSTTSLNRAISGLGNLIKKDNSNAAYWYWLASALAERDGASPKSLAAFEAAYGLSPNLSRVAIAYSQALIDADKFEDAYHVVNNLLLKLASKEQFLEMRALAGDLKTRF